MHIPAQLIDGALRLSFSRDNSLEEAGALLSALSRAHSRVHL